MAGIVGFVETEVTSVSMGRALAVLCHHPSFRQQDFGVVCRVALGAAYRGDHPPDRHSNGSRSLHVLVYGNAAVKESDWIQADAKKITELYERKGISGLCSLDGSYVIVVVDEQRHRLVVANDRSGSCPVYFATDGYSFAFAPESKALFRLLEIKPKIDIKSAISFLTCGYPIGPRTMFEGVNALEPAHVLVVDIRSLEYSVDRYWDLCFDEEKTLKLNHASSLLYEVLTEAHIASLAGLDQERVTLALSGGFDSRAMLAVLDRIGRLPSQAVTWGVSDSLDYSDPVVARELAAVFGVPFRFSQYDSSSFLDHLMPWAYISEMMSDNLGFFAAGADFLIDYNSSPDYVLIGDHILGLGGIPNSIQDAVENVTKAPLFRSSNYLDGIFGRQSATEIKNEFSSQIENILKSCPNENPKDIQDYLYFHLLVFRWLYSPGYYKEPMLRPIRPMMRNPVLDLYTTFPQRLRIDKRVFIDMLWKHMPDVMELPKSTAHSLVDWSYEIRKEGAIRNIVIELLDAENVRSTVLGEFLDIERYRQFSENYFSRPLVPVSRKPGHRQGVFNLRRKFGGIPGMARALGRLEPTVKKMISWPEPDRSDVIIRRIALICLFHRCIDEGWYEGHAIPAG